MRRLLAAVRDQLRNHVDAAIEHAVQRMRIVRRDIMLLRIRRVEPLPGLEEEFIDLDVGRHLPGADRSRVVQRRVSGEQALGDGVKEAAFQLALGARGLQCQRRENGQVDRGVGRSPGIERIGDVIGLAEAERQGEHDRLADLLDNRVGNTHRIVKTLRPRTRMDHCRLSQPGSGWNRGPYCSARRLSVSRTSAMPRVRA